MHTLTDGVVLKGVHDGGVDEAMSFVKYWSDGLQTARIHTMHACIINEGGVVAIQGNTRLRNVQCRQIAAM